MQHKYPCRSSGQCFWADSLFISGTSPGPPAHLTLQYQTSSTGDMLNVKYMKHVLLNADDQKQRILEVIQEIPTEMLHHVMTALPSRLQECIERYSGHLQWVIFK